MFFFLLSRHIRGLVFCLMLLFVAGSNVSCFVDGDGTDDSSSVTITLTAPVAGRKAGHLPKFQASGWIKANSTKAVNKYTSAMQGASGPETGSLPPIVPLRT
jgi:hypothetical protein